MIRAIVFAGWAGLFALLAASLSGFWIDGTPSTHMLLSLVSTGLLLCMHLGLGVYFVGAIRLVRRTVDESGLDVETWAVPYESIGWRGVVWVGAGFAALVGLFASGIPAYTGQHPSSIHLGFAVAATVAQAVALLALGPLVKRGESHLAALDQAVS